MLKYPKTSWDTRVFLKCSDAINEPRESLNCYVLKYRLHYVMIRFRYYNPYHHPKMFFGTNPNQYPYININGTCVYVIDVALS